MKHIRVLVATGWPSLRVGLVAILRQVDDLIVGEAVDADEVVRLAARHKPDVLLVDAGIGGGVVTGVLRDVLRDTLARPRVLVFGATEDERHICYLLQAGAAGYVLKDEAAEVIVAAVRKVAAGEAVWLSSRVADKVAVQQLCGDGEPRLLTRRQEEVLALAAQGKTNAAIGRALGISAKTVEKHLGSTYAILGVHSRLEAVIRAQERGLLRANGEAGRGIGD